MSARTPDGVGSLLSQGLAEVKQHRGSLMIAGIISLILGTFAIIAPLAATVAVVWIIGAVILLQGIIQLVHCFKSSQWNAFAWNLLWAVVYILVGAYILVDPIPGAVTLTLLLAVFFIVEGVVKLGLALKIMPAPRWGWILFSGIMGLVLGLIIFAGWPGDSLAIMGLLLGIDLIFSGWSMVMLASAANKA